MKVFTFDIGITNKRIIRKILIVYPIGSSLLVCFLSKNVAWRHIIVSLININNIHAVLSEFQLCKWMNNNRLISIWMELLRSAYWHVFYLWAIWRSQHYNKVYSCSHVGFRGRCSVLLIWPILMYQVPMGIHVYNSANWNLLYWFIYVPNSANL